MGRVPQTRTGSLRGNFAPASRPSPQEPAAQQCCCRWLHRITRPCPGTSSCLSSPRPVQQQLDLLAPTDLPSVTRMLPPGLVCAGSVAILPKGSQRTRSEERPRSCAVVRRSTWQGDLQHRAPVLDLSRHGHERLLNVCGTLRRGLQEWDANLVCEGLQRESEA